MNEMFFATVRVLVEGIEDIGYISAYLTLMDKWQEFRSYGCHLVQVQGKSHLIQGIAIAQQLELPTMVVFDCDGDTPADDPSKPPTGRRAKQEADNNAIFKLMGTSVTGFPADIVWADNLISWPTKIGDVIKADIGADHLTRIKDEVRARTGNDLPDMDKNPLFIGYVMAQAWTEGRKSPTLEKLCTQILAFAADEVSENTEAEVPVEEPVLA